ncbi:hypothetical protein BDW74DRAFT_183365 [Aspergillus multicolor]|uniref:uncharacterized protein n=1 Tax=Aspergillus multicolor TaxID=41759 RepID=UPI003CCDEA0B
MTTHFVRPRIQNTQRWYFTAANNQFCQNVFAPIVIPRNPPPGPWANLELQPGATEGDIITTIRKAVTQLGSTVKTAVYRSNGGPE